MRCRLRCLQGPGQADQLSVGLGLTPHLGAASHAFLAGALGYGSVDGDSPAHRIESRVLRRPPGCSADTEVLPPARRIHWCTCACWLSVFLCLTLGGSGETHFVAAEEATQAAQARYNQAFEAMLADPTNTDKAFAFAEAAVAVGDLDGAIAALERILLVDPDRPDIKIRLGELYERIGAPEIAQLYLAGEESAILGGLEGRAVPPEIRDRARALVERAERERAALARHRFYGSVFLGGRYETNANAGPGSNRIRVFGFEGPFLDDQDTEQADFSAVATSDLHYAYDFGKQAGHALEADVSLFGSRYAQETQVNTWLVDFELGPRFFIGPIGQPVASLRPFGEATYVSLDDETYLSGFGGGLNGRLYPLPNVIVEVTGRVLSQNFDNTKDQPSGSDQTGTYATLRPGVTWQVLPLTLLSLDGLYGHNDADEDFELFDEYGVGLSATQLFPVPFTWLTDQLWSASLTGAYRRTNFDEPDPQVDPDTEQEDDRFDIGLSLSVPITDHLNVNVVGLQTFNEFEPAERRVRQHLDHGGGGFCLLTACTNARRLAPGGSRRRTMVASTSSMAAMVGLLTALLSTTALAAAPGASEALPAETPEVRPLLETTISGQRFAADDRVLGLLLRDGTSLTLARGGALSIDQFVFDPAARIARLHLTLERGLLRIGGGRPDFAEPVVVTTPAGEAKLTQGVGLLSVAPDGTTRADLLAGGPLSLTAAGQTEEVVRPGFETLATRGAPPQSAERRAEGSMEMYMTELNPGLLAVISPGAGPAAAGQATASTDTLANIQNSLSQTELAAVQAQGLGRQLASIDPTTGFGPGSSVSGLNLVTTLPSHTQGGIRSLDSKPRSLRARRRARQYR